MSKVWLAVGTPKNWQTALEQGRMWGLKQSQMALWNSLAEGDLIIFYATLPVGGVIGYGSIHTKLRQDRPLWPQEVRESRVIWPLRLAFQVAYILPQNRWASDKIVTSQIRSLVRSGFQMLNASVAQEILSLFSAATPNLPAIQVVQAKGAEAVVAYGSAIPTGLSLHDTTKLQLVQIGRMQAMIAESEYALEGTRLDVVWRRMERAVPFYAFEVQVGGDIYHALVKLKHAVQLWNTRTYVVAPGDETRKYESLLAGAFHEERERMTFVDIARIDELYQSKLRFKELERQLGIQ